MKRFIVIALFVILGINGLFWISAYRNAVKRYNAEVEKTEKLFQILVKGCGDRLTIVVVTEDGELQKVIGPDRR